MKPKLRISIMFLGSLGLAGLLLLSMGLSLALAQEPFTKTRVTVDGNNRYNADPILNANGTILVFWSDADLLGQGIPDDQFEIWLYDTTTMTLTRVTTSSDGVNRISSRPSLNADGTKVAFNSNADFLGQGISQNQSEIWLYDTTTMTVTRVTTSGPGRYSAIARLNADGTKMAFESTADFLGQGIQPSQPEIWLYDTATLTVTRVTTSSDGPNRGSIEPRINADGSKVVFYSNSDFLGQGINPVHSEIWLFDTDTMTVTRITTSGVDRGNDYADLSANGTKVALASDSDFLGQGIPDDQFEIWLYDTATMTVTRVTTSSDGPNRASYSPNLSADGTKVAFSSDSDFLSQGILQDQFEIWLYDTTTMTFTRVTSSSDGANRASYFPDFSGDGTKVTFVSDSDFLSQGIIDQQFEIWLFGGQALLNLAKTVDDNTPEPGQVITYSIVVANSGTISATGLTISDTTPLSLTFISGSTTITPIGNGTTGDAPTLVSSLTLTAGQQVTVTYQVTATLALTNGDVITNTASLTSPDMMTPVTAATVITASLLIIDPPIDTVYLPIILKN